MKTLKQNNTGTLMFGIMTLIMVLFTSVIGAQTKEVEFDVYTNSAAKASRYLLADDVTMRECASTRCEQVTTINIGTNVRLLAKSEVPQTISGITSRWYKVKLGPDTGWIWGGLIAQKTMTSNIDPEVKFVFGEAGEEKNGNDCFQIRALKNGEEIDRIIVSAPGLSHETVSLISNENTDVIRLTNPDVNTATVNTISTYVVFIDNKLSETTAYTASKTAHNNSNYATTYAYKN